MPKDIHQSCSSSHNDDKDKYLQQLEEIKELLALDPENSELQDLKQDLEQILSLLQEAPPQSQPSESNSQEVSSTTSSTAKEDAFGCKIGQQCKIISSGAKAEICSIAADRSIFTLKLIPNGTLLHCKPSEFIALKDSSVKQYGKASSKEAISKAERIKKKKQLEKFIFKQEHEQQTKKAAWQSFQSRLAQTSAKQGK